MKVILVLSQQINASIKSFHTFQMAEPLSLPQVDLKYQLHTLQFQLCSLKQLCRFSLTVQDCDLLGVMLGMGTDFDSSSSVLSITLIT